MTPKRRCWNGADEIELISKWGAEPIAKTADRLGRTTGACREKLRRLLGSASIGRGRWTLTALSESSGYHRQTILAVVREMGMRRVVRRSESGPWVFSDEQADRIMDHIKERGAGDFVTKAGRRSHSWSRQHSACLDCDETTRPHWARGRCRPCYEKCVRKP